MAPSVVSVLLGLALLGLVFACVERRARGGPWFAALRRPGARTDLLWWLTGGLVVEPCARLAVAVAALLLAALVGVAPDEVRRELAAGRFPDLSPLGLGAALRALPFGLQLLLGLFVADLLGYAQHRLFHRGRLWRFHAVHHASERLDWLAAARVHPVNEVLGRLLQVPVLLLLGFDPRVFASVGPLIGLYGVLLHADVRWTFGPLRHVLASPVFHRWHHSAEREALDRNFAGLFPVIDLVFGTFHLPAGRLPERLGVRGSPVPAGFLAQWAWPLRRARRPRAAA